MNSVDTKISEARPQNAAVCESADGGVSLGTQLNQSRLERFPWAQCFFALPFLIALIDYFGAREIKAVPNHTKLRSLTCRVATPGNDENGGARVGQTGSLP
jgi:hypothetical protein